ncbi:MAG: spermidine/putrescine ABC transporter substrate-binding protein [Gammaproteobacteria bacterium]|nr:spermidine/putrescine ABC transporter substrate-binding protein [Gammaproteobacteria bacterium]
MKRLQVLCACLLCFYSCTTLAGRIVNVYLIGGEIPQQLIWAFEKETGINVNVSTYDTNETMYAKLRANKNNIYDVIIPSSYFVERLKRYHLLEKLDPQKLSNLKNIDPFFRNNPFDPGNHYHVPLTWGTTGLFYNQHWIKNPPHKWQDLWNPRWRHQLLLVDDIRDVFAMSLLSLGYDPNDTAPKHIDEAYQHLLKLVDNIKLFGSDAIKSLIIDEDVHIGMSWSGEIVKSQAENPNIRYVYPEDGVLLWVDCLAIPKHAPHLDAAYAFINFLLRAQSGADIVLHQGYSVTNQASLALLPPKVRRNPNIFPNKTILKRGHYQRDVDEKTIELYSKYWEKLKLAC